MRSSISGPIHQRIANGPGWSSQRNDPPLLVADVRRLREEAGWQPKISLEEGLEGTIKW
jgi:nucleoside-diphosphate-sugar epimerase